MPLLIDHAHRLNGRQLDLIAEVAVKLKETIRTGGEAHAAGQSDSDHASGGGEDRAQGPEHQEG